MKKFTSMALAIALISTTLPALASGVIVRTEPNNGFVLGADPEWSASHQTAPSNMQEHRQYHRDAETARLAWLSLHASERGSHAYSVSLRQMLQLRNLLHRQYHAGWMDQNASSSRSRSISSSLASSLSSSWSTSRSLSSSAYSSSSSVSASLSSSSSMSSASNPRISPVSLESASTFAVLAGSTVTNIGQTVVTGDIGVSPGSAVTGFGPGVIVNGALHLTDTLASQAKSALTTAYNDLAGRTLAPISVSGNLGGRTLRSGLYKSTSGLEISSGDLVLDANGDTNAQFIFQIASTLNVSTGRNVILIGGAKASNVFWQVGTSANLESNSVFKGSILADQSISLQTGANVEGRLLARIGGVTLQGNTVTVPN